MLSHSLPTYAQFWLRPHCPAVASRVLSPRDQSARAARFAAGVQIGRRDALPRSSSFSSRRASLLSRRSCLSISSLILLASFASSLRQHAIMDSRVILSVATRAPLAFSSPSRVHSSARIIGVNGRKRDGGPWTSDVVLPQAWLWRNDAPVMRLSSAQIALERRIRYLRNC